MNRHPKLTKKGFPPLCIPKQPTETSKDRCWGGSSTGTPKRNERETTREKNADNGGSTETKKLHDHCAHRRSPTKLQGSEVPVPISTSKKDRDELTKTTLLPRVSPGTRRGERKCRPRRPPGRSGGTHRRRCRTSRQGFPPIPNFTSDAPEPATKPTTILRHRGHEASTPSHHDTMK